MYEFYLWVQWLTVLNECGYIHRFSMIVSYAVLSEGSEVTHIY